jgi:ABC-2 type transport system permease protein
LAEDKLPKVAFLSGHGERDINNISDRGYNTVAKQRTFRHSLLNQGVDFEVINLDKEISQDFKVLVIAEMREPLTASEEAVLADYIEKGGNVIFAGEARRREIMNPLANKFFGVDFSDGELVKPDTIRIANLGVVWPTPESESIAYQFRILRVYEYCASMPSTMGLDYTKATEKGWTVTELFRTDSLWWNEKQTTDFVDEVPAYNPEKGEVMQSWATAISMSRKVGDKEQKIIGDDITIYDDEETPDVGGLY